MLRWSILLLTFALWLSCMLAVHIYHSPVETLPSANDEVAAVFEGKTEPKSAWAIYVDKERLKQSKALGGLVDSSTAQPGKLQAWNGVDENGRNLASVGFVLSLLHKKAETRLEQTTRIRIDLPQGLLASQLVEKMFGNMELSCHSDISQEKGLEYFRDEMTFGLGLSAAAVGFCEGGEMSVTMQLLQERKLIFSAPHRIPLAGKEAPMLHLFPFQANPKICAGYKWDIFMAETNLANTSQPTFNIVCAKAVCTGKTEITFDKGKVNVFVASTEDGKARAWYSADGVVLKQTFLFAGAVELILVRLDPERVPSRWMRMH